VSCHDDILSGVTAVWCPEKENISIYYPWYKEVVASIPGLLPAYFAFVKGPMINFQHCPHLKASKIVSKSLAEMNVFETIS